MKNTTNLKRLTQKIIKIYNNTENSSKDLDLHSAEDKCKELLEFYAENQEEKFEELEIIKENDKLLKFQSREDVKNGTKKILFWLHEDRIQIEKLQKWNKKYNQSKLLIREIVEKYKNAEDSSFQDELKELVAIFKKTKTKKFEKIETIKDNELWKSLNNNTESKENTKTIFDFLLTNETKINRLINKKVVLRFLETEEIKKFYKSFSEK